MSRWLLRSEWWYRVSPAYVFEYLAPLSGGYGWEVDDDLACDVIALDVMAMDVVDCSTERTVRVEYLER